MWLVAFKRAHDGRVFYFGPFPKWRAEEAVSDIQEADVEGQAKLVFAWPWYTVETMKRQMEEA